jgi:hypothetical protein
MTQEADRAESKNDSEQSGRWLARLPAVERCSWYSSSIGSTAPPPVYWSPYHRWP